MATTYWIWWIDESGTNYQDYGPHSNFDVYCINWDGVTNPIDVDYIISPYNYWFPYDCAEDICSITTHNNITYYGTSYNYTDGTNKILKIDTNDANHTNAKIAFKSDGTIECYNCVSEIDGYNIYIKFSNPNNLYAWTDSNVTGEQLYGWTDSYNTTVYTKSATPSVDDPYYDENGNDITGGLSTNGMDFGNCYINRVYDDYITIYVEPT